LKRRTIVAIFVAVIVATLMIPNLAFADSQNVEDFVTRFYNTCLDRQPDGPGLTNWVGHLTSGRLTGADVAYHFIFSEEFQAKNTSHEQFLLVMYRSFFNRLPDPEGYAGWLGQLEKGRSRSFVLSGFVNSVEFASLCSIYGINTGSLSSSKDSNSTVLDSSDSYITDMLSNLNHIRKDYGLNQVALCPGLNGVASWRAEDMISCGYFSHISPSGISAFDLMADRGIVFSAAAENINQASPPSNGTVETFLASWMDSGPHRQNILNSAFTRVGIGMSQDEQRRVLVMVFAN